MTSQIVQADLYSVSLPYVSPVEWTTGGITTHAHYVVARIVDADGQAGAAEVPCFAAWNGMSQSGLLQIFQDVAWPMLSQAGSKPLPRVVRDVGALTVLVDNLVDDLEHGIAGSIPVGEIGPAVFVITRGTPAEMAVTAKDAAKRGFRSIKIKLGQGLETDAAAIKAIRGAVGDNFALCADANGAYGSREADALLQLAEDHGLFFVEDPCVLQPLLKQVEAMARAGIPVVPDRYCNSLLAARQFIELGLDTLAAKPTRVGVSDAGAMIAAAEAGGGKGVIGLFGESAAGAITQLRFASRFGASALLGIEASAHEALADNFLSFPISVREGAYQLPPSLHLATAIDWQKLEALAQQTICLRI